MKFGTWVWRAAVLGLGLLALALYFWPLWTGQRIWYSLDFSPQVIPGFRWMHEIYASGQVPFWCPDIFLGHPMVDESLSGAFYPPQRLLLTFLPGELALLWLYVFEVLLAGLGGYFLARALNLGKAPALLLAVSLSLGGGMTYSLHHPANVASLAWLPWQALGLEYCLRLGKRFKGALLLGCAAAMAVTGGHLVISIYGFLALGLRLLWQIVPSGAKGRARTGLALAGAILLALFLAGGQMALTQRYVKQSLRAESFNATDAAQNHLTPASLIHELAPFAWGDLNDNSFLGTGWPLGTAYHQGLLVYPGLLIFFLALLGVKREKSARPWFVAWVLLMLYALGPYTPMHKLAFHLPFFSHFRGPMKAASLTPLLLGLPAAFGLRSLLDRADLQSWARRLSFLALGGLLLAGGLNLAKPILEQRGRSYLEQRWQPGPAQRFDRTYYLDKWSRYVTRLGKHATTQAALLALAAAALWAGAALARRKREDWAGLALASALGVDLLTQAWGYYPTVDRALYDQAPATAAFIRSRPDASLGRVYGWGWSVRLGQVYTQGEAASDAARELRLADMLSDNAILGTGLSSARGYTPIELSRYRLLFPIVDDFMPGPGLEERSAFLRSRKRAFDLASVNYLVAPDGVDLGYGKAIWKGDGMKVYANPSARPFAWLASSAQAKASPQQALDAALKEKGNLVFSEPGGPEGIFGQGQISAVKRGSRSWIVSVQGLKSEGFLVLSSLYYEGLWKAWVDNKPARIWPVNGALSGVVLPPGSQEIDFWVDDSLYSWAMVLHLAGWALLGLGLVSLWRKKRGA